MRKYRQRAFDWNGATCIHLLRTQMVNMGHRPPRLPAFRSMPGAIRAMRAAGFADVAAICAGQRLMAIAPAAMLVGDVALLPGDDGLDAVVICAGGKMLGWHSASDGSGIVPIAEAVGAITSAWRL